MLVIYLLNIILDYVPGNENTKIEEKLKVNL